MELTKLAKSIMKKRYLHDGETIDDLPKRVGQAVAEVEQDTPKWREIFIEAIDDLMFIPSSPILMSFGGQKPYGAACNVLPIGDSMRGIMKSAKDQAMILKFGGGTGMSFGRLRSKGIPIGDTGGKASGPCSFIDIFASVSRTVEQGGRRRGANMGVLPVHHPDIEEFIGLKKDGGLEEFNLSVGITDEFMNALQNDTEYSLYDPVEGFVDQISADRIWNFICNTAWECGDPGLFFLDTVNKDSMIDEEIEAPNPCSEEPLPPFGSCFLGHLNLPKFMKGSSLDWDLMDEYIFLGTRFLDNAIDVTEYPVPEVEETAKKYRLIGLGHMGISEVLARQGLPYDSAEGRAKAEEIQDWISSRSLQASRELGNEKGCVEGYHRRNAWTTTVAPTGTTSIFGDTTQGPEPPFKLQYTRTLSDLGEVEIVSPQARALGVSTDEITDEGTHKGKSPLLKTAGEIDPIDHVKMLAAIQDATHAGVSKTVNAPNSATPEDIGDIYSKAYELGCKGITVFREGCKTGALNVSTEEGMREREDVVSGITVKYNTGCGTIYCHVNSDDNGLLEAFTSHGKGGGCPAEAEAMARLTSLSLREGIEPDEIVDQLKGIKCLSCTAKGTDVSSCPDALARSLNIAQDQTMEIEDSTIVRCPHCGAEKINGRCGVCPECGEGGCN